MRQKSPTGGLPEADGRKMMLDFRVKTFLTVCETMNFTRAADALNVTQPAVSQHIRYMEGYYGVKLFSSRGKRIELTEAGELLKNTMLTMQHDVIFLKRRMGELPTRRSLHFGVTLTVGEYIIPEAVRRYLCAHPDTAVKMVVANTQELLRKLDGGEIDFALVEGHFAKSEYDHLVYATEPYVAVCGAGYPFRTPPKTVEDLAGERIIVREPGSGSRDILERYLEERSLKLSDFGNLTEIGSIDAIKELVKERCGITFLYEAAARRELKEGTLQKIPLKDFHVLHDLTFIWRHGSAFSGDYAAVFSEMQGKA